MAIVKKAKPSAIARYITLSSRSSAGRLLHSGIEYSASNILFKLLKWLASDDVDADKSLVLCNITIVAVPNPYGYKKGAFNGQFQTEAGGDPYAGCWTVNGVNNPTINWEAFSIQKLIDNLNPELYIDCHGVSYKNQTMIENTGVSVHGMNRPHRTGFVNSINSASKELGYHSEQFELRQKPLPVIPEIADRRYQTCSPAISSCTYAYHNYHTLAMTMEVGHEESGLARLKKALSLADFHWDGERSPGYPVNRLYGEGHHGLHSFSNFYPEKRNQRKRIWNCVNNYATASIQPQYPGHEAFIIFSSEDADKISDINKSPVMLQQTKNIIPDRFIKKHKDRWLGLSLPGRTALPFGPFSVSIKIPFRNSNLKSVSINSFTTTDYVCVEYGDFSMVFINFPDSITSSVIIEIYYDYTI